MYSDLSQGHPNKVVKSKGILPKMTPKNQVKDL